MFNAGEIPSAPKAREFKKINCETQYNLTFLQPFWEKEWREAGLTKHLGHPELPSAKLQEYAGDKGLEQTQVAMSTGTSWRAQSCPEPAADATPGCVTAPIPQATAGSQQVASDSQRREAASEQVTALSRTQLEPSVVSLEGSGHRKRIQAAGKAAAFPRAKSSKFRPQNLR